MAEFGEYAPGAASERVVPSSTLVGPWKVLVISAQPRVTMPCSISIPPVPQIDPLNAKHPMRSKARVPLSTTLPVIEPVDVSSPSWRVTMQPIVVPPE